MIDPKVQAMTDDLATAYHEVVKLREAAAVAADNESIARNARCSADNAYSAACKRLEEARKKFDDAHLKEFRR